LKNNPVLPFNKRGFQVTLNEVFFEAKRRLHAAGIDSPSFDAACIFEKHTGVKRSRLPLCGSEAAGELPALWQDIDRRAAGEPLQYILGEWDFLGLPFRVGPGVLIPRPETELLAQAATEFLQGRSNPRMLELCAGSGCVTIATVKMLGTISAYCLEISDDAIGYLEENIKLNQVQENVQILHGDMLDFRSNAMLPQALDLIVCNPPYIRTEEIVGLQREVKEHEPALALDGGGDGLVFYRAFAPWAKLLKPGGMAAFEVGAGQAEDVAALLQSQGLEKIFIKKDYSGIERVVGGYKK
jgi:release factor glutamine methyltransferase